MRNMVRRLRLLILAKKPLRAFLSTHLKQPIGDTVSLPPAEIVHFPTPAFPINRNQTGLLFLNIKLSYRIF